MRIKSIIFGDLSKMQFLYRDPRKNRRFVKIFTTGRAEGIFPLWKSSFIDHGFGLSGFVTLGLMFVWHSAMKMSVVMWMYIYFFVNKDLSISHFTNGICCLGKKIDFMGDQNIGKIELR